MKKGAALLILICMNKRGDLMKKRINFLLALVLLGSFVLQGCFSRKANSFQKTATMTLLGAGAGYGVGQAAKNSSSDDKYDLAPVIGAGVGSAAMYLANQTYKGDYPKGYEKGWEAGVAKAKVDYLERLAEEEMEGKYLLGMDGEDSFRRYVRRRYEAN